MDYVDLVNQQCPPEVVQSVSAIDRGARPSDETLIYSNITGAALSQDCAYAVVGHLAKRLRDSHSSMSKNSFIFLARRYNGDLQRIDADSYKELQLEIAGAIQRMIGDLGDSQLRGGMLDTLMQYRVNILKDVEARVDYKSLTQTGFLADWQFNEYAACMGDAEAPERLEAVLKKSAPQDIRLIFTDLRGKVIRKAVCLQPGLIKTLARPYLRDQRATADVNGDGPPVSDYAKDLLEAL